MTNAETGFDMGLERDDLQAHTRTRCSWQYLFPGKGEGGGCPEVVGRGGPKLGTARSTRESYSVMPVGVTIISRSIVADTKQVLSLAAPWINPSLPTAPERNERGGGPGCVSDSPPRPPRRPLFQLLALCFPTWMMYGWMGASCGGSDLAPLFWPVRQVS